MNEETSGWHHVLENPHTWVYLGFFIFLALVGPKLWRALAQMLDRRALKIKSDLDEAQKLLERASRLRPEDVDVTDALGWAYYLRGDAGKALPLLERAAKADPSGSRINEHLGDIYWHLGRRYEARYAWRAAEIYADAGASARLQMKLANGPSLN